MSLARKALLAMSTNAWLRDRATRTAFVRRSVSTFMPGERLDDAIVAAKAQEQLGIRTIFTKLGENLTRVEEAEEVTQHYLDVLDKVQAQQLQVQVSVKPTQLGLDLDRELCYRNLQRLVDRAAARGNFIWIDMESSPYVDPTIDLFRRTRERSRFVGIALQAYLYRTAQDIEALLPLGSAIRMVKGAYLEPPSVAYPKKSDVDENFYTLSCRLLSAEAQQAGRLLHIATHDPALVDRPAAASTSTAFQRHVRIRDALWYPAFAAASPGRRGRAAAADCIRRYWFPGMRRLAERWQMWVCREELVS
jgi:proline dehydrogenase